MTRFTVRMFSILVACLLGVAAATQAADWRQWGGPNRDFQVEGKGLADSWPKGGPKRLWTQPLGPGYSAIAVAGDKVLAMYRSGEEDVVAALNADTGEAVWKHAYTAPPFPDQIQKYGTGPNSSPLVLRDRLIAIGFTGRVKCLSLETGQPIWSHDLVKEYGGKIHEYGYSPSPIAYGGHVIVLVGGEKNGVIAFNPADGSVIWKSEPYDISYASPIVINVDGQDQLVFFSSTEIIGLDAKDGGFLWRRPCENEYKNNATDPIWGDDNLLWVATQMEGGTRVLRLTRHDGKTEVEQVWFNKKVKIFHWNALRIGDFVYASLGTTAATKFTAVDVKTGRVAWRDGNLHKALCLYADGKLIILEESGQLTLAKASPEKLQILSKAQVTEKVSWTIPTLVGTTLYLRDMKSITALDLGP